MLELWRFSRFLTSILFLGVIAKLKGRVEGWRCGNLHVFSIHLLSLMNLFKNGFILNDKYRFLFILPRSLPRKASSFPLAEKEPNPSDSEYMKAYKKL